MVQDSKDAVIGRTARWVTRQLLAIPAASRFQLAHGSGEVSSILFRCDAKEAGTNGKKPDAEARGIEIATTAIESALDCQEAYEGKQVYKLRSFGEDNSELSVHPFSFGGLEKGLAVQSQYTSDLGGEFGGEKNLVAILTKMVQNQHHYIMQSAPALVEPLVRMNASLHEANQKLRDKQSDTDEMFEGLSSLAHTRDQESEESKARRESRKKMIDAAIAIGTAALMQKMGGELPASTSSNEVEKSQERLRKLFRIIPKKLLYDALEETDRTILDNLLGIGESPKDVESFRIEAQRLWAKMPDTVLSELTKIFAENPALFVELESILKGSK